MIKKLIVLSAALAVTACSTVTNEPVKIAPFEYNISASKNDIYLTAVDCTLDLITAPTSNGQFFDYQDKESGRLAVAFQTKYPATFGVQIPLKTTMTIKASDNKLNIRFGALQQDLGSPIFWTNVYKEKDGSTSEAEIKLKETANSLSNCIRERA